ncbi:MAG: DUF3179 domain-containing protein [Microthrixaceae bacterium]
MGRGSLLGLLVGVVLAGALAAGVMATLGREASNDGIPSLDPTEAPANVGSTLPNAPGDDPTSADGAVAPDGRLNLRPEGAPKPLVGEQDIREGGPRPDGIPPIDEPHFTPASEVQFLSDREPVLAVTIGEDTRAYPLQIMLWHEIVNDTVGEVPVSVTYCPLCNSAFVWERTVGDRVLSFGTSGKLYNSSLVAYDRQTRSLWAHFTGEAVAGELTGSNLTARPSAIVSWGAFRSAHPDAPVLNRTTGATRDYGSSPYPGYDDVNAPPFLFDGETDDRLAAKERVLGVSDPRDGAAVAITFAELQSKRVVPFEVGDRPLVALFSPGTTSALDAEELRDGRDVGAVNVIDPTIGGLGYEFVAEGDQAFVGTPADGSGAPVTIDVLGRPTDGAEGPSYPTVTHVDTFWFAWAVFQPDTELIGAG